MSLPLPIGYEILHYQNTRDELMAYREKGALRGVYLGFPNLHENYTMASPGVTDWTGYGGSGKTEFLLELLLNTSLYYGWKHLLYVPDVGDKNEILSNLIHKLTGKSFDKRYKNYINELEVDKNLQWILSHFYILYEKDEFSKLTPFQFWDFAAYLSVNEGLNTASIDSWKDLEINVMPDGSLISRDDVYLSKVLKYRNKIADKYKLSLHTIIHPTNIPPDKDGVRPMPKPYNLSGGAQWLNGGRVMVSVHRTDGTENEVSIVITKAKPKSVAKLGTVKMFFDVDTATFYWENNGEKTYANKTYFKPIGITMSEQINDDDDDNNIPF